VTAEAVADQEEKGIWKTDQVVKAIKDEHNVNVSNAFVA